MAAVESMVADSPRQALSSVSHSNATASSTLKGGKTAPSPAASAARRQAAGARSWSLESFEVGKPLGRGKFGNVYMAREKATGVVVALKVIFKEQVDRGKTTVQQQQRKCVDHCSWSSGEASAGAISSDTT